MVGGEKLVFATLHQGGLLRLGMVVAEHVKHAMNDQKSQLIVDGSVVGSIAGVLFRLSGRVGRAHNNIADEIIAEKIINNPV